MLRCELSGRAHLSSGGAQPTPTIPTTVLPPSNHLTSFTLTHLLTYLVVGSEEHMEWIRRHVL